MPFRVRKVKGSARPYKIQRKRGGKWSTVGSSSTQRKAHASKGIRAKASGHK